MPAKLLEYWAILQRHKDSKITTISSNQALLKAMLNMLGAADEACKEVSYPKVGDPFSDTICGILADTPDTLCRWICPQVARVLPKIHTPQVGMTLRSLSHHLAFCGQNEVDMGWYLVEEPFSTKHKEQLAVNLLIFPYPFEATADNFVPTAIRKCGRTHLPEEFGFFTYNTPTAIPWINGKFREVLMKLKSKGQDIHGIILPEGSFPSKEEFSAAHSVVWEYFPNAFFLVGIAEPNKIADGLAQNYLQYAVPIGGDVVCLYSQSKHHRWRLDESQIKRYQLDSLDRGQIWWESIDISKRRIQFFSAKSWLTFCFLICEDLARQEPVAPLVRAIGPHLVVALLQDGPQMIQRWPNRYAGVLADDPGSAVLTVTSVGMIKNCSTSQPFKIGLWCDRRNTKELELEKGATAVLLKLASKRTPEFSADGRENPRATALLYEDHLSIR
ncbi:MAG: hypothetical protein JWQ71_3668 [Pedosphaera sp.]|nr:hypothetical protein [Pedosphaera sp.]